jgi:hypothetical protein
VDDDPAGTFDDIDLWMAPAIFGQDMHDEIFEGMDVDFGLADWGCSPSTFRHLKPSHKNA